MTSYLVERIQCKKKKKTEFYGSTDCNRPIPIQHTTHVSANYFGCEPVRKGPEIFDDMVCLRGQPEARTGNSFRQLIHLSQHHSLTAVRVRLKLASITAKLDTRPL